MFLDEHGGFLFEEVGGDLDLEGAEVELLFFERLLVVPVGQLAILAAQGLQVGELPIGGVVERADEVMEAPGEEEADRVGEVVHRVRVDGHHHRGVGLVLQQQVNFWGEPVKGAEAGGVAPVSVVGGLDAVVAEGDEDFRGVGTGQELLIEQQAVGGDFVVELLPGLGLNLAAVADRLDN